MDTEESQKKFEQGKEVWNAWAADFLNQSEKNEEWYQEARVTFVNHKFENSADFRDFIFPDAALFYGATFKQEAEISGAKFYGVASFDKVNFKFSAGFSEVVFKDAARFTYAFAACRPCATWSICVPSASISDAARQSHHKKRSQGEAKDR